MSLRPCLVAGLIVMAGCTHRSDDTLYVVARGLGESCSYEIGGRTITAVDLPAVAQAQRSQRSRARVHGFNDTPYRCVGAAVYLLQQGGFRDVDFSTIGAQPKRDRPGVRR